MQGHAHLKFALRRLPSHVTPWDLKKLQPHQDTSLVVNTTSKLTFYLLHDANPNFLMKLLVFRLLEESLLFMELQIPLTYLQEFISGHHPKPVYFSPHKHTFFLYYTFNIILSVTFNSFKCFLVFRFDHKRYIFIFKSKDCIVPSLLPLDNVTSPRTKHSSVLLTIAKSWFLKFWNWGLTRSEGKVCRRPRLRGCVPKVSKLIYIRKPFQTIPNHWKV